MDYKTAVLCANLSQEVYQTFSKIKFRDVPNAQKRLINEKETDTQLAILYHPRQKLAIIVFRGSEKKLADWATNFNFGKTDETLAQSGPAEAVSKVRQRVQADLPTNDPYQKGFKAQMHRGFATAYLSVRDRIQTYVKRSQISEVILTGHSLGGALATLCGLDIQYNFPDVSVSVYTYGSPKVGNRAFVRAYNQRVPKTFRFVYGRDIVPQVPRWWMGYCHVAKKYRLGPWLNWKILSRRIRDHKISNYIESLQKRV